MGSASGDPDGALCGDYPRALAGAHGHDSQAGVDQLVFGMGMFGNDVAVGEFEYKSGYRRRQFRADVDRLSFPRHLLSE